MTQDQESQLLNDVATIKRGLFGDPTFEQAGLVHEVSMLKAWQGRMQSRILMITGGVAVAWFVVVQGFSGLWAWVSTLGKK